MEIFTAPALYAQTLYDAGLTIDDSKTIVDGLKAYHSTADYIMHVLDELENLEHGTQALSN